MSQGEPAGGWPHLSVLLAVILAIGLRAAAMFVASGAFEDPDNYLPLAGSLAHGEGLSWKGRPTAYRPPLYPLILAPLVKIGGERPLAGIAVLHLALGAATVALTAGTARRWGLSPHRVVAAAAIVACDPVVLWQSRFVMTETLGAFLVALALFELTHPRWRGAVGGGACLGLAALCRPSLLPGGLLIAVVALLAGPGTGRERLVRSVTLGLAMTAVLSPWAARNALMLGEPVWTTTHGGYTLALGNNDAYYHDVLDRPPGQVWYGEDQWQWWDSVNRATAGMTEPQADRFLRNKVVKIAHDEPVRFLRACLQRLSRFWSVAPAEAVYSWRIRWMTAAWTIPLWIAMAKGSVKAGLWRWPRVAAPLVVAGLTAVHSLYWTDVRMRAPIVPAIALIAVSAAIPARSSDRNRTTGHKANADAKGSAGETTTPS